MIVVLMGVSGAGKTAVGRGLADAQGWSFIDGDDLHAAENIRKMATGIPLTDQDREPWLRSDRDVIDDCSRSKTSAVVACSALRRSYRRLLTDGLCEVRLVYLRGDAELLERRLSERRGHYFDPKLLASQMETLEEPANALVVDVDDELDAIVRAVRAGLGLRSDSLPIGKGAT